MGFLGVLFCLHDAAVPGGNRSRPVLHSMVLSRGTPQPNVRTFHSVAQSRLLPFCRNVPNAHITPLC